MRYLTLLWTTALAIPLLAQAPTDDAPERRLLRAELLEISAGDLETATTIYRELASDEEAPASIRARALLYIGRTQRKLGELRAAEDTLREVLRLYPDDAAVARQAKSFLAELRSGKTTNVKFDWLAEMEAAPEIQARVFDLAMGLANEQWNPDDYGQLVALGRLAVPVVDKLAESTRQTDHRQRLTLVLLRSGRFDRLPWLLNGHIEETLHAGALDTFLLELSRSSPDERSRMVEALDRLPAAEPAYCAAALRLAAGDVSRLDAMLRDLEQARRTLHRNVVGFMLLHAKADPEVAATIAARILDADLDIDFRRTYYDLLKSDDSPQLGGKHLAALLRDVPHARAQHYVSHINDLEAYRDIAATELSGPVKKEIRTHFRGRYRGRFDESEAGWERVLRAVDGIFILQHLAETRDSAIDEFVDFLRNRRNEHPGYWSYNRPREDTSIPSRRARQRGGDDNRRTQTWKPSPRYADAMASLLDVEDPVALAVALEALSLEPVSSDADDDTRFDPIVRLYREAPDPHVREFAFYSLLRRYARAPELRRRVAAALLETTSREATPLPSGHYLESPLHDVPLGYARDRHRTERSRRHVGTERVQVTTVVAGLVPTWPFNRDQLAPEAATLLAELWALAETEADARLLRVFATNLNDDKQVFTALVERFGSLEDPAVLNGLSVYHPVPRNRSITHLDLRQAVDLPGGPELVRRVAPDSSFATEVRVNAMFADLENAASWFDLPVLFAGSDPFLKTLLNRDWLQKFLAPLSEEERTALLEPMLESSLVGVVKFAVLGLSGDAPRTRERLEKALEHPAIPVQVLGLERLMATHRADVAPILHAVLTEPKWRELRDRKYEQILPFLVSLASEESLAPIASLLEDPNVEVRKEALHTLTRIRDTLKAKEEWEAIIRRQKPTPTGRVRPVPQGDSE